MRGPKARYFIAPKLAKIDDPHVQPERPANAANKDAQLGLQKEALELPRGCVGVILRGKARKVFVSDSRHT